MVLAPYKLVVFDWEGTLGDPHGVVLRVLCEQATSLGLPLMDACEMRRYLVFGLDKAIRPLFPTATLYQCELLINQVQQDLSNFHHELSLFPGARAVIETLHSLGIHLAIATNKNAQSLHRSLQQTALEGFFQVTRSAGQVAAKPSPQMLEEIMDTFGIPATETLMIGDSISDMEMARTCGASGIGVDFYHQQADDLKLAGAVCVFDDYQQIGHYLTLPGYT